VQGRIIARLQIGYEKRIRVHKPRGYELLPIVVSSRGRVHPFYPVVETRDSRLQSYVLVHSEEIARGRLHSKPEPDERAKLFSTDRKAAATFDVP
jgi:hypothetical protein